jgi:hypothetical protein
VSFENTYIASKVFARLKKSGVGAVAGILYAVYNEE